eukprot:SAG31_NODE_5240_length_2656_cov_4.684005_2_plen_96_part_00
MVLRSRVRPLHLLNMQCTALSTRSIWYTCQQRASATIREYRKRVKAIQAREKAEQKRLQIRSKVEQTRQQRLDYLRKRFRSVDVHNSGKVAIAVR